jgi:extracellular elastinolytic metalloproteinase
VASEFTWQGTGSTTYSTTRGNNGIAQANYEGDSSYLNDYRPIADASNFNYELDLTATDPKTYVNASVTQLWYTSNMYHDLLYTLGFTEAAGNFETNNNGQGGQGNDAVILNAQDGSGTNNANFATPVDGQPGRMRMYIWTYSTPVRDCSFDAGVVIHEYTHGLSNRLTGGPANSGCLSTTESGGMGEGWSDFMAIAIHIKTSDTRATNYPMGDWVRNLPQGIRAYLYSTSLTTNPFTYKSANGQTAVHYIGTIWATILYEVMWNLIDAHGITSEKKPTFVNGVPADGRFLAMKLVVDGMAL